MKRASWSSLLIAASFSVATSPAASGATGYVAHGTLVSGPAAVRVWVDGGDVFPDYEHVVLRVRPERDCYTSLFLVDTAGFIHVLNAGHPHHDGWLHGGRTYAYHARDLGLHRFGGRGIAYVFAVGSPVPFDYSYYGAGVYAGGFGFRIIGDPFAGGREFYMSLLPTSCRWDHVGVSYTRFYVREWVRYPSYLCAGGHVRVGDGCRHCESVYASYRGSVASPYEAIRPVVRYKDAPRRAGMRYVVRATPGRHDPVMRTMTTARIKNRETVRVVSTSREIERARVSAPAVESDRASARPVIVAGKSRSQKRADVAQPARGKGASEQVRQAE